MSLYTISTKSYCMIKVWTWRPLPRGCHSFDSWDELHHYLDERLDEYEAWMNERIRFNNLKATEYNAKIGENGIRLPLTEEKTVDLKDVLDMITVFDTEINEKLQKL